MKQFSLFLILFLCSTLSFAQMQHLYDSYDITEAEKSMSQGFNNSFSVQLVGATSKMAEDVWKSYIKNYGGKTKRDRKLGEYFTDDAKVRDLSDNTIDVYASFSNADTFTVANIWFDLGGAYLSTKAHSEQSPAAEAFIKAYTFEVGREVAKENLKVQEKYMKSLQKEFRDLEKDNETYHRKIEEAKKLIAEMEKNIEVNLQNQETKKEEINIQGEVVKKAEAQLGKYQ